MNGEYWDEFIEEMMNEFINKLKQINFESEESFEKRKLISPLYQDEKLN